MSSDNGGIIGVVNDPTSTTASGVWQQEEQYEAKVNDTWPQRPLFTTKSLRFNDGSSDSLNRTPSGDGNKRTFTFSTWLKISTIKEHMFFTCGVYSSTSLMQFYLNANGTLTMSQENSSGSIQSTLTTTQVFRDTSAWYHFVIAIDTTQGTDSNRVKLYVNGSQVTSFSTSTYPSQNLDFACNTSSVINTIGNRSGGSFYFDGYMAEIILVDGSQLAPTSFGETDSVTNNWVPKDVSGLTFGTNGFYLDFKDSSALGNDVSGNNNDYTANNLTSIDQSVDTCTNSFITMNPNNATLGSVTLSEGNLKASLNGNYQVFGTINLTSGKWYWEQKLNDSSLFVSVADGNRATEDTGTGLLNRDYAWAYRSDGVKQHDGVTASYGNSFTTNDIIGVALDMDNGFIYFSKNGTFQNSGDPTSGSTGTGAAYSGLNTDAAAPNGLTPCLGQYGGDQITSWNFGSPPYAISSGNTDSSGMGNFEYAVPSGYYSICTRNLNLIG